MKANEIGSWIKNRREEKCISRAQLCKELGYSITVVSTWELNKSLPRTYSLADLLEYFGYDFVVNGKIVDLYNIHIWIYKQIKSRYETIHDFYKTTGISIGHLYYGDGQVRSFTTQGLFAICEHFGYNVEFNKKGNE